MPGIAANPCDDFSIFMGQGKVKVAATLARELPTSAESIEQTEALLREGIRQFMSCHSWAVILLLRKLALIQDSRVLGGETVTVLQQAHDLYEEEPEPKRVSDTDNPLERALARLELSKIIRREKERTALPSENEDPTGGLGSAGFKS